MVKIEDAASDLLWKTSGILLTEVFVKLSKSILGIAGLFDTIGGVELVRDVFAAKYFLDVIKFSHPKLEVFK